jgi:hypothetical protein
MPVTKAGAPGANLDTIRRRLDRAVEDLGKTQETPGPQPGGWTPAPQLTQQQADKAQNPLARQAWRAGNVLWGTRAQSGGGSAGWTPVLYPKHNLQKQDLANLQNVALRVLASVIPPGATEVPAEVMDNLPAVVDAYWKNTFSPRNQLLPEQRDALVQLIRSAAEGE